jgi:2'-5' RNA ligase
MNAERWRCFVAVPLGEELRTDLVRSVDAWRRDPELAGLRWADPEAWHVTLAFMGGVEVSVAHAAANALVSVAASRRPMTLATGGLGAFPSAGRARVLWYRVEDPGGELASLAAELTEALGLEPTDRFRPHVTLARARREAVSVRGWLESVVAPGGALDVRDVRLVRSHLGGGPARYETLTTAPLGVPARV